MGTKLEGNRKQRRAVLGAFRRAKRKAQALTSHYARREGLTYEDARAHLNKAAETRAAERKAKAEAATHG